MIPESGDLGSSPSEEARRKNLVMETRTWVFITVIICIVLYLPGTLESMKSIGVCNADFISSAAEFGNSKSDCFIRDVKIAIQLLSLGFTLLLLTATLEKDPLYLIFWLVAAGFKIFLNAVAVGYKVSTMNLNSGSEVMSYLFEITIFVMLAVGIPCFCWWIVWIYVKELVTARARSTTCNRNSRQMSFAYLVLSPS